MAAPHFYGESISLVDPFEHGLVIMRITKYREERFLGGELGQLGNLIECIGFVPEEVRKDIIAGGIRSESNLGIVRYESRQHLMDSRTPFFGQFVEVNRKGIVMVIKNGALRCLFLH